MPNKWTRRERRVYKEIGERVRELRTDRELSQADLGDAAGLTRAGVANIEAGLTRIQVHTLLHFASVLMVPVARLLPKEDADA